MDEHQPLQEPKFRGLYRNVNISVRALDFIIVACIVVIIVATIVGMQNPGYTVTFDSRGGTDVAPITVESQTPLELPDDPTREGYVFDGWYLDPSYDIPWNEEYTLEDDITLYAGWKAK